MVGLGRFSVKLGPETPRNGSGSKNGVECIRSQTHRTMLKPFRVHALVQAKNKHKFKMHELNIRKGIDQIQRQIPEPHQSAGKGGPGHPRYNRMNSYAIVGSRGVGGGIICLVSCKPLGQTII